MEISNLKAFKATGEKKYIAISGEKVTLTDQTRDLGHGLQILVIYSDESTGYEHTEDLID